MIYKLEEICEFINGGAWSDKEYVPQGLPVLKVTNCKPKGFLIDDINYLPTSSATKYAKHKVQRGDVIIATVGSHPNLVDSAAGRSCIINSLVDGFYLNQNAVCIRTKDNDILDQGYLGYHAKYREFQHYIQMRGRGAANQMRIAIGAIKGYEFDFPEIDIQRKIAYILSAYDNLIENNQKQIKLLEEAARRLYKEWFVDLRFPGYEDVAIVDGVPEGWKKDRAESFFNITIGKTPPRAEKQWFVDGNAGIPWLSISDMGNSGVYTFTTSEALTQEAVKKHNMKVVPAGTIFVSFKLTVGRVSIATTDMCTNEAIAHFYMDDGFKRAYTYCYLNNFKYDTLGNTSSISKAVNSKIIKAMPFVMPDESTVLAFDRLVSPILKEIKNKQAICIKLKEARDRLLPKLMSGEIEV